MKLINLLKCANHFLNKKLYSLKILSNYLLRFGLGISFIIHGFLKFPLPPNKLIEYFNFSPFLASFVAISEVLSGTILIISGFINNFFGNLLTRISSLIIIIIMLFAFYYAHQDWFINSKLFTSEQIFLLLIGLYFFINGNLMNKNNPKY